MRTSEANTPKAMSPKAKKRKNTYEFDYDPDKAVKGWEDENEDTWSLTCCQKFRLFLK